MWLPVEPVEPPVILNWNGLIPFKPQLASISRMVHFEGGSQGDGGFQRVKRDGREEKEAARWGREQGRNAFRKVIASKVRSKTGWW